jgi:hypothetical protein
MDPLADVLALDAEHRRAGDICVSDGETWPCDAHELLTDAAKRVTAYRESATARAAAGGGDSDVDR